MTDTGSIEGSWQPDPLGRYAHRWWDGTRWTDRVGDAAGTMIVDPLGTAVSAPNATAQTFLPDQAASRPPDVQHAPPPQRPHYLSSALQTPNYNLPGGGAWAAPQQIVTSNATKSPGLAISSLVLGVGAFFISLIPVIGLASIPFAIVGLALGIAGVIRANKGFEGRGLAITGIVTCLAALLVSVVYIFAFGTAISSVPEVDSDTADGVCDHSRFLQDPDC